MNDRRREPPSTPLEMRWQILRGFALSAVLLGPLLALDGYDIILYLYTVGGLALLVLPFVAIATVWWRSTRGYALGIVLFYLLFVGYFWAVRRQSGDSSQRAGFRAGATESSVVFLAEIP